MDAASSAIFGKVQMMIESKGLSIVAKDDNRPWGGFFVIDETQAAHFIETFFPGEDAATLTQRKVSPKILIVAPGKRLSWQYHHRRAELWRVIEGPVKVMRSLEDAEVEPKDYPEGEVVRLAQGERHRLIGAHTYGIVAEIWQHTDPEHPSNEDDIVRLQDDFGRR